MNKKKQISESKRVNKLRIAKYISSKGTTSKSELAQSLNLSMPTVLQNVSELLQSGIVVEDGEYQSTGGRRAKALSIAKGAGYVIGIDISKHHVNLVLVNTRKEMLKFERIRKSYINNFEFYEWIGLKISEFISKTGTDTEKIIGVGISLPGVISREQKLIIRSHVLGVENVSFKVLESYLPYHFEIDNDANSAAYAEWMPETQNAVYLSLNTTVGGAFYLDGKLYPGENFKSAEFGHMIIEKDGKPCYCGKNGCVDAYCGTRILQDCADGNLEFFFKKLQQGNAEYLSVWNEYLDYLAITISNLRMSFDCDIILGGYLGGYLNDYQADLSKNVLKYNNFDLDTSYIHTGKYKLAASAYGVTMRFIEHFLEENT